MREGKFRPEPDPDFQDKLRKAAAAILKEEESKVERSERPERARWSLMPRTVGPWLLVLGAAAFAFSVPSLGLLLLISGIAAIAWEFAKPSQSSLKGRPARRVRRSSA